MCHRASWKLKFEYEMLTDDIMAVKIAQIKKKKNKSVKFISKKEKRKISLLRGGERVCECVIG